MSPINNNKTKNNKDQQQQQQRYNLSIYKKWVQRNSLMSVYSLIFLSAKMKGAAHHSLIHPSLSTILEQV